MSNSKYIIALTLLLSACAQTPEIGKPKLEPSSIRSITQLHDGDKFYVVYNKDKNGTPTSINKIAADNNAILEAFKKKTYDISMQDCIFISRQPQNGHSESVCDHSQWSSYYSDNKTFLMTRSSKDAVSTVFDGAFGLALSPLGLAVDALSGDSSMKHTKGALTASTKVAPNYEALAKTRQIIDSIATEAFNSQKKSAENSLDGAVELFRRYPKTAFRGNERSEIIRSSIEREYSVKSEAGLIRILDSLAESKDEKDLAIARLRNIGTFQAYSHAFKVTGAEEDAKNANMKAVQPEQKKMAEYMFIKVLGKRSPESVSKLFTVKSVGGVSNSGLSSSEGSGFLVRATRDGTSDFTSNIEVHADRNTGIFEYGAYDVTIRATVHVPQYVYQRSNWIGNKDEHVTSTTTSDTVVRVSPPNYVGSKSASVNNVVMTRLERGAAGGITQVQQTGEPRMTFEVVSAKPVE